MPEEIILASASPRRSLLLELLGISFQIDASAVDEDLSTFDSPEQRAIDLAIAKARAGQARHPGAVILAADTLIAFHGRLLGKPLDAPDAVAMLRTLRGRWHRVITGVAVINGASGQEFSAAQTTRVLMRHYTDDEIDGYVASGDPMDKAAAYAVQNGAFHPVERLDTCYTNVMGLPLCTVSELLGQAGVVTPIEGDSLRCRTCSYCRLAR